MCGGERTSTLAFQIENTDYQVVTSEHVGLRSIARFRRPGGYGGGSPPDPIPNSVVKSPCADGTASSDVGE